MKEVVKDGWRADTVARGREKGRIEPRAGRLRGSQRSLAQDYAKYERDAQCPVQGPTSMTAPPHGPPEPAASRVQWHHCSYSPPQRFGPEYQTVRGDSISAELRVTRRSAIGACSA